MFIDSAHEGDKLVWILTTSLKKRGRVLDEQDRFVLPQHLQRAVADSGEQHWLDQVAHIALGSALLLPGNTKSRTMGCWLR